MKKLAFLLVCITITYADRCPVRTSGREAFCANDWVAHVKVLSKAPLRVDGSPAIVYTLQHVEMFRTKTNPPTIVASDPPSKFGFEIEDGKEYVMAGYDANRIMNHSCKPAGMRFSQMHWLSNCDVLDRLLLEWEYVSEKEKEDLRNWNNLCP